MPLVDRELAAGETPPRLFMSILGGLMIFLAGLMAFLPRSHPPSAVGIIGSILMVAGFLELLIGATAARWSTTPVLASGLMTTGAALIVLLAGPHNFFTLSAIVAVLLLARSTALFVAAFRAPWRAARAWLLASATGNAVLAFLAVMVTMSVMIAHLFFGPAPKGAGYSAIPALSLLFNGIAFASAVIAPLPDKSS